MKHKIYKFSRVWYGDCGACPDGHGIWGATWNIARDRLEMHVREHAVDVLTGAVSTAHDYRGTYPPD